MHCSLSCFLFFILGVEIPAIAVVSTRFLYAGDSLRMCRNCGSHTETKTKKANKSREKSLFHKNFGIGFIQQVFLTRRQNTQQNVTFREKALFAPRPWDQSERQRPAGPGGNTPPDRPIFTFCPSLAGVPASY